MLTSELYDPIHITFKRRTSHSMRLEKTLRICCVVGLFDEKVRDTIVR